jgi:hypothetical protein
MSTQSNYLALPASFPESPLIRFINLVITLPVDCFLLVRAGSDGGGDEGASLFILLACALGAIPTALEVLTWDGRPGDVELVLVKQAW